MSSVPIDELLKLSVAERIQLVEDLWDSIASDPETLPLTDAQKEELDRRLEEHRANPDSAVPWAEVRERLYEKYGGRLAGDSRLAPHFVAFARSP